MYLFRKLDQNGLKLRKRITYTLVITIRLHVFIVYCVCPIMSLPQRKKTYPDVHLKEVILNDIFSLRYKTKPNYFQSIGTHIGGS